MKVLSTLTLLLAATVALTGCKEIKTKSSPSSEEARLEFIREKNEELLGKFLKEVCLDGVVYYTYGPSSREGLLTVKIDKETLMPKRC